eukprot:241877-Rhodomonas_salina.2
MRRVGRRTSGVEDCWQNARAETSSGTPQTESAARVKGKSRPRGPPFMSLNTPSATSPRAAVLAALRLVAVCVVALAAAGKPARRRKGVALL